MNHIKLIKDAAEMIETAIHAGDWKVDGACDPDMLLRRLHKAIQENALREVARLGQEIEADHILDATKMVAPKRERVVFPTMLRKMWSGGEVQAWLDENVNKENNS